MGESLKDQLVALGLKKDCGKGARKGKGGRRPSGESPSRRASGNSGEPSLEEAYRQREKEERRAAEARKQAKLREQRRRREINRRIAAIVERHKLNDEEAEARRNFQYKGRIRSVRVTEEQLRALNAGELGVAFLRGGYFVLAPEHLEAVRAISEEHVVDLDAGGEDPDDEEFPVPDDLVW